MRVGSPPSIRHFVRRRLPYQPGSRPSGADSARAFERACQSLHFALAPLISSPAFEALVQRAMHLARREFPLLERVTVDATKRCSLGSLPEPLNGEKPHPLGDALALVLANLIWLLRTLLGVHLTVRAVKAAWPEVSAAEAQSILDEGNRDDR